RTFGTEVDASHGIDRHLKVCRFSHDVAVGACLNRRLAIAEYVIGESQTRIQVLPIWHVGYERRLPGWQEPWTRPGRLRIDLPVEVVDPHPEAQRPSTHSPLIMPVQSQVVVHAIDGLRGLRSQLDLERLTVQ